MTATPSEKRTTELRPGSVLAGRYALVRPLAEGGMGRVWIARNLATGAEVAAKVLLPERACASDGLARFRREAEATAKLTHRGIVRIFDLVELDHEQGSLVMIMELLRGHTLAHHLQHAGKLPVAETLAIFLPLLSALAHAHALGIVHRDLKPENIFLAREPDGECMPKIVDFGISKQLRAEAITLEGQIVGTLRYMSPEQALGDEVDARSDVFSLGILLYECLSGTNPFVNAGADGLSAYKLMTIFAAPPAPLTDVPPGLWAVLRRALSKGADERFENAAELAEALKREVPAAPSLAQTFSARASTLPPAPLPSHSTVRTQIDPVVGRTEFAPRAPRRSAATRGVLASAALVLFLWSAWGAHGSASRVPASRGARERATTHDKHLLAAVDVLSPSEEIAPAPGSPRPHLHLRTQPSSPFAGLRPGLPRSVWAAPRAGRGVAMNPGF